jgi:hypothetical protein
VHQLEAVPGHFAFRIVICACFISHLFALFCQRISLYVADPGCGPGRHSPKLILLIQLAGVTKCDAVNKESNDLSIYGIKGFLNEIFIEQNLMA